MPKGADLKGRWALVTGASSGLGADFARELAAVGCSLVLSARREEALRRLAAELEQAHGTEVVVLSADLGVWDGARELYERVRARQIEVDVLVNSAGFGPFGDFLELPWEKDRDVLLLNVVAVVQLTKLFARDMAGRGFGRILQVASTAAYQPVPSMASYGASKAFVQSFGEALAFELRRSGVTCTVLSPGYTETGFFAAGGQPLSRLKRASMMESSKVARIGIKAMLKGRPSVVAGFTNALLIWSSRFSPRRLAVAMSARVIRSGS
jgi:short-subunit dehydrogenase